MPPLLKTTATAAQLGVPYHRLFSLVRYNVIAAPKARDSSGHYWWSAQEVEAARRAIAALDARRTKSSTAVIG